MNKEFNIEMIRNVMNYIANKNHFFVSEVHLQTEFIIAAAKLYPEFNYYPELVPSKVPNNYINKYGKKGTHFDLLIKTKTQKVLIEFKYITDTYSDIVNDIFLEVKSHMAMDIRRYDCWKDIERIERFSKSSESDVDYGYFILVTNVPALWDNPGNNSLDAEFHIENGLHKHGLRKWRDGTSKGTTKGRELPIETDFDYVFKYYPFFDSKKRHGEFRFLVVDIF